MSHPKNKLRKITNPKVLSSSLKKLPAKKTKPIFKKEDNLQIDVRGKKDWSSIIELTKRTLTNSSPSKMPSDLKPMLAILVNEPFTDKGWQFELKLDGYRALAYLKNGTVDLRSRNNNSFNRKSMQLLTVKLL